MRFTRVDVYHNIPDNSGGTGGVQLGSLGTNYYSTSLLHTPMGLRGATVQYVDTGKYQVTATVYNMFDKRIETRRAVVASPPTAYSTAAGYTKVAEVEYDDGGVGDGYVTSAKSYYDSTTNDYIETKLYRTFRGHVRGIKRSNSRDGGHDITPYTVMDVDWFGRTTASAQYTTAPTPWPTNYSAYVFDFTSGTNGAPETTGHNNLSVTRYDALGRVYRRENFPGTEGTDHFESDNFYDRRGDLVATGDKYSVQTEMAYDGCQRQYQSRTVKELSGTTPLFQWRLRLRLALAQAGFRRHEQRRRRRD